MLHKQCTTSDHFEPNLTDIGNILGMAGFSGFMSLVGGIIAYIFAFSVQVYQEPLSQPPSRLRSYFE
jgi:hypothetical protein